MKTKEKEIKRREISSKIIDFIKKYMKVKFDSDGNLPLKK